MAEKDLEAADIERKVHNLAEAMTKVRTSLADRDDVVVEMKDTKINRLKLLADDLAEVRDDIPKDNEQFEFAVTNGETPRLWIDMTSFVRMGGDSREYEFVKDTRLGRTILGRTADRKAIGERITEYVAERLLERERMIEGDWIAAKSIQENREDQEERHNPLKEDGKPTAAENQKSTGLSAFSWVMIGLAIGLIAILGATNTDRLDPLLQWLQRLMN
ncbi:MAG: hypothetical protein AAGA53_07530 [Pseudomonadota bacterium]